MHFTRWSVAKWRDFAERELVRELRQRARMRDENEAQAFDEDAPTTVMREEVLEKLTERARRDSTVRFASPNEERTVVARRSAAEIMAEAGGTESSSLAHEAPVRAQRGWRGGAIVLILATLVAASWCALRLGHWPRLLSARIASAPLSR
jgi:hypothetical protein